MGRSTAMKNLLRTLKRGHTQYRNVIYLPVAVRPTPHLLESSRPGGDLRKKSLHNSIRKGYGLPLAVLPADVVLLRVSPGGAVKDEMLHPGD